MTLTSADLFATSAPEMPAQPFPDDMHDVPLQNSLTASSVGVSSGLNSPKSSDNPANLPATSIPSQFPLPRRQHVLTVSVHSPEGASESTFGIISTSHTVFTVETTSTLTSFPKAHCCVKRRFSDFAALYDALHIKFAGYFIPPCPSKDLVQGKLIASKFFLRRRVQDLEVFVSRCCDHSLLRPSTVLTLFLTLDISASSSHRLAQHPEWKQAVIDEPLFRSFQLARNLPSPTRETLPSACPPGVPVTSITSLGLGLLKGVQILGRKVHSSISATPVQESTGDPAVDAVLSQVAGISERANKYTELLRLCSNVTTDADSISISLHQMRDAFEQLCVYEDSAHVDSATNATALASATLEHSKRLWTDYKKVAYAAAWVSRRLDAFVTAADDAALPWRHCESGLRASHRACEEGAMLWGAMVQLQRQVQHKRERYHIYAPETSESGARSEGLREIQKSIDVMEEQVVGLRADLVAVKDVKEREMDNGSKELQRMVPLAVLQVAQVQHGLCEDAAKHWECLARRLGADMAGL